MRPLRHLVRRLGRTPMFTSIALITLALGIGANTAIFSVINGVLLKPLPFPDAGRLVGVWHLAPGISGFPGNINCSPTMYFTYRDHSQTFQEFGLWSNSGATVTGLGEPEALPVLYVTYDILRALEIQPALGRAFSEADDKPGTPETVILTYGYWQRRFGGSSSAIGRTLVVDSKPQIIIGVMPRDFRFLNTRFDLILPERFEKDKIFLGQFSYQGIARLKPGASIEQANRDVSRMLPGWLRSWPPPPGLSRQVFENAHFAPHVQPLKQEVVGDIGATLWVLMGTLGLVLLIACANVANLLLVRAESRQHELAIRAALGAGWGQIAREMLLESLALGVLGGAIGLALASGALGLLVAKGPQTLPRLGEIEIDPAVLAFTLVVSLLAGLLFGLIPVIKYAGPEVAIALRGGRTMSQGRERHRARNTLVVVQMALALVLLIGSGLMIRTFQALRSVQPGFSHPEEVQLLRIAITDTEVKEPEKVMRMENAMIDRLASIPGVSSVSLASSAPLEALGVEHDPLYARDKTYSPGQIPPLSNYRYITPGFFKTNGTSLIAGRDFTWTDIYDNHRVAIVSENQARQMWGSPEAALGKQVRSGLNDVWREVIAVVADVYEEGMDKKAPTFAYWPALMEHFELDLTEVQRNGVLMVRTRRAGTESFLSEARQAIWSINPNVPVFLTRTQQDLYSQSMARTSFTLVLLAIAGAMALILGVVGIYGVIAYAVTQRTREIGIRIALGAESAGVLRMFVRQGLLLAAIGSALGLIAAAAFTRLMSSLLFKTTPLDPLTYGVVALMLVLVAVLASYIPARRATVIDPAQALRTE